MLAVMVVPTVLGGVVWLVRLESKVKWNDRIEGEHHTTVIKALDRLDGKMEDLTSYILRNGYGKDRSEKGSPTAARTYTDRVS